MKLTAVLLALQWVEQEPAASFLICSDSIAVLNSLISFKYSRQDILNIVLGRYCRATYQGKLVHFMWVPAHVGLTGNEVVDTLAVVKGSIDLHIPLS